MKCSTVSTVAGSSSLALANKNSTHKRASKTNPTGVPIVARRAKRCVPEAAATAVALVVAAIAADVRAKCSPQPAATAAAPPRFRSTPAATNQSTAATASLHDQVTDKKNHEAKKGGGSLTRAAFVLLQRDFVAMKSLCHPERDAPRGIGAQRRSRRTATRAR
jgi:hypothetical protein